MSGPSPPPNGGTAAWLHVLGSALLYFNTWGISNAFGVYQTYYESGALFHESSSDISWIGSIAAFMLLITGVIAGPLYDRGYMRTLLLTGSFMVVFGYMMLSICRNYWEVLLAQGFVVGIGTGLLFVPCVAVLPQYFSTRLGMAVGIAVAGSSLGGVIYPIVLYQLIGTIGFGWATRVVGFIALGTLVVPTCILRQRIQPPKVRAFFDKTAFTDLGFLAFVLVTLVAFMSLFCILFYISYFALDQHITNEKMAFYLVPIFNAASCFGRTFPNALADKTGPFNLIAPGSFIAGVLMLCLLAVKTEAGIIVIAALSGFMSGVLIALPPLCFVALTRDKSRLGTRIGLGYALIGMGVLAGGPGAGAILGTAEPLNWQGLWVFGGVSCCVAGVGYAGIRVVRFGGGVVVKA